MPGLGEYQSRGFFLEQLDDFVAVARRFGDQRQRDQPQVALRQHAARAHMSSPPSAKSAVASAKAETAEAAVTAMAAGAPMFVAGFAVASTMSMSMHILGSPVKDISLDRSSSYNARYIFMFWNCLL